MTKLLITLLMTVTLGFISNTYAQSSSVYGSYKFEAEDAPWEYQSGTIAISNLKDHSTVSIVFEQGGEMELEQVKIKGNTITAYTEIDYEGINFTITVKNNKLIGNAQLADGSEIPFEGDRVKK